MYICICTCIYIYICIERERGRKRERERDLLWNAADSSISGKRDSMHHHLLEVTFETATE